MSTEITTTTTKFEEQEKKNNWWTATMLFRIHSFHRMKITKYKLQLVGLAIPKIDVPFMGKRGHSELIQYIAESYMCKREIYAPLEN